MANKIYPDYAAGTYDTAKIFLQSDPVTGALEKINLPTLPIVPASTRIVDTGQHSNTGSTTMNTVLTIPIPADFIGTTGSLHIYALWSWTNNANTKTLRIATAGNTFLNVSKTTDQTMKTHTIIYARNSQTSQVRLSSNINTSGTFALTANSAPIASTEDFTTGFNFLVQIQNANAGDTASLEAIEIIGYY